ncbi:hypothetical protein [Paenibacillus sp. Y412MC10]|uniref:hypothetical protein n=1 Tax=Geobacillus sp. (strain Y412MC10) TaxID=481743 RepID=UPI0011A23933|nr:hypothetical protein [Paenibacillus sp. Y412MC10]
MKKLCIYSKQTEADGAHFVKREHILSAGLGGRNKLEQGMVSDEINLLFSKWETQFLRYSHISLVRQMIGPGNRGSLDPKKASQSVVNVSTSVDAHGVEDTDDVGLCYVELGIPYTIDALRISKSSVSIIARSISNWESFIDRLKTFPENDFRIVPYDQMPSGVALIGFHDKKWHMARSPELELEYVIEVIQKIKEGKPDILSKNEMEFLTSSHQQLSYNEIIYSKVIAKYAFNFLAHCIGQDAVLQSGFDPLRDWIMSDLSVSEPSHHFVISNDAKIQLPLPEYAHSINIVKQKNERLIGLVDLYGGAVRHAVLLSSKYEHDFPAKTLVCDWKNQNEFGNWNL